MAKHIDMRQFVKEACFFGLLWQIFAGISMYLWNPEISNDVFPDLYYSKLIAGELLLIALFSVLAYLTIRILLSYVFYSSPKSAAAASMFVYMLIVTIYVSSWVQFLTFGKFITLSSIYMFVASPGQILMHANDLVNISIYRIALIPAILLISLYLFKKYVLERLPYKVMFSIFLALNVVCALINTLCIEQTQYSGKFIQFHRTVISLEDYMDYLKVTAAGPLITLKETAFIHLLSERALQMSDGVTFDDILSSDQVERVLSESNLKDWDVIIMEIESLNPKVLTAINANLQEKIMPVVDAIAADSHLFTNAYAQASHSSYADLVPLSSQYPLRSEEIYIYPEKYSYPKVMIYDVLSKIGYKTAIISSQNEEWQGMDNYLKSPSLDVFIHAGNYSKMLDLYKLDVEFVNTYEDSDMTKDIMTSFAGKLTDRSTVSIINSWISTLNKDERYFLYTNLQNSHFPYYSPADRTPRFFKSKEEEDDIRQRLIDLDRVLKEKFRTLYHESLSGIDEEISRLVNHLKRLGRWRNTLLVITADTSSRLSGSRLGNGGDLFEDVLHVPLIIKVPGKQAVKDARLIQHLDVTPTVLGYMGLKKYPVFQGKDFSDTQNCNSYAFAVAQTAIASQYTIISDDGIQLTIDANTNHVMIETLNNKVDRQMVAAKKDDLFNAIKTWIDAQLIYYDNGVLMHSKYPPKFSFENSRCN